MVKNNVEGAALVVVQPGGSAGNLAVQSGTAPMPVKACIAAVNRVHRRIARAPISTQSAWTLNRSQMEHVPRRM